jgi:hypothetical protein
MGFLNRRKQERRALEGALGEVRRQAELAQQLTARAEADVGMDMSEIMRQATGMMAGGGQQQMAAYAQRVARLAQTGVETPAVLRAIELGEPAPLMGGVPAQLELMIEPAGGAPYAVATDQVLSESMAGALAPGQRLTTKVDPADPQAVIIWAIPAASDDDSAARIAKLEQLHARGVLTDAEFEAQKAKLEGHS